MLFEKQKETLRDICSSKERIFVLEGSVRSGKTTTVSSALPLLMERCPEGDLAIVGVSQSTIDRNVIKSLKDVYGFDRVKHNKGTQKVFFNDRVFHCIGASDDRAEGKIKGATFAGVVVDEVTEIPKEVFMALIQRISLPGAFMLCTTNPDSPDHWFKKEFLDKADSISLKRYIMLLGDNPFLPKEYTDHLKNSLTGVWYRRMVLGEWSKTEGLIFPTFDKHCIIQENNPTQPKWAVSVDVGSTNPCVFLMIGTDPYGWPRMWVEEERYFSSKKEAYHKTELEHVQDCIEFCKKRGVIDVYVDPSAISFITALRKEAAREAYNLHVKEANNHVLQGIMKIDSLLATGDLKIKHNCTNLISEMHNYSWNERSSKEEPIKEHDHAIDALRYFINSCPQFTPREIQNAPHARIYKEERNIWNLSKKISLPRR